MLSLPRTSNHQYGHYIWMEHCVSVNWSNTNVLWNEKSENEWLFLLTLDWLSLLYKSQVTAVVGWRAYISPWFMPEFIQPHNHHSQYEHCFDTSFLLNLLRLFVEGCHVRSVRGWCVGNTLVLSQILGKYWEWHALR